MREPERIERICNKLKVAWEKHPDWRLGQLVMNLARDFSAHQSVFHTEDDTWEIKLDELNDV